MTEQTKFGRRDFLRVATGAGIAVVSVGIAAADDHFATPIDGVLDELDHEAAERWNQMVDKAVDFARVK